MYFILNVNRLKFGDYLKFVSDSNDLNLLYLFLVEYNYFNIITLNRSLILLSFLISLNYSMVRSIRFYLNLFIKISYLYIIYLRYIFKFCNNLRSRILLKTSICLI